MKSGPVHDLYSASKKICRIHARSFYFTSFFLPLEKRNAAYAVYGFCRLLDDATDHSSSAAQTQRQIDRFKLTLDQIYASRTCAYMSDEPQTRLAMQAFAATVLRYNIPRNYFDELAEGCQMDLTISQYATWEDLRLYCFRVAGVVGLIMSKVFGLLDPAAEKQAVLMGEAMQLTNILRDIREDCERGRVYLPLEDLTRFGYSQEDLARSTVNQSFKNLMRFEIERARQLFREGAAGLMHIPNDGSRFTASSMAVIYSGILNAIERQNYDVFHRRARLNFRQKLLKLPAARRLAQRPDLASSVF